MIYYKYFKRPIEFILAMSAIFVLAPVMLIIAVLVRLYLGSPVIFKQKRPGLNEKIFTMYKFRTMTDAKDKTGRLLEDRLRLTKFGKILRSISLDELPELWNIIRGDMSLVGPRPLLIEYLPFYSENEKHRHDVRPGLTGLAQISGRNYLDWNERLQKDLEYINNVSFCADFKILFVTVENVLMRKGVAVATDNVEGNLAEIRSTQLSNNTNLKNDN